MRILKPLFYTGLIATTLVSCGSVAQVMSTNPANIDKTPLKTTPLSEKQLQRWGHLDLTKDTIPGMSVDKAYAELLKGKKGVKVIVGIVDSGVDIEHKDLKGNIWINKKEIAGNKKDDDKNGFIDDINGWNFLGDITKENLEYERIVKNKNLVDEQTYNAAKALYDSKVQEATQGKAQLEQVLAGTTKADEVLVKFLGKPVYTAEDLKKIDSKDPEILQSKSIMQQMLGYGLNVADLKKEIKKEYDGYVNLTNGENLKKEYRKVLGDNPEDIKDTKYGNNSVMGPDKDKEGILHGTHVAGIIAQLRNNNLGGDGIANNVEIMTLRAVPDGDEYDKDIALAIRYAVDNGAKVINGSFGKSFSPHKEWVYNAIKYAASKDVLFVHAAGNDGKDIDIEPNFPNDADGVSPEYTDNVLTIGALNYEYGANMVANFSNYGKTNVDVFAPGVKIYATTPNNNYQFLQGTSMASPNVAGVATLIRSYYPRLTASQVKHIIMDSGTPLTNSVAVGNPSSQTTLGAVSITGKIVNAYNALVLAGKLSAK
jgi:cell wall-associated protease